MVNRSSSLLQVHLDAFSGGRALARFDLTLIPAPVRDIFLYLTNVPSFSSRPLFKAKHETHHPFNMDDVQCDDSFGDDEMLDDLPESQHDELPISVSAANVTFSKPDHDILPASDASKDPTAGHSPASSQGLEADDGSIFSSRVYPRAGEQQAALAATPEDVTPAAGTSVLARIENIFEAMADVLLNERGHLSVELVTRPRVNRQRIDPVDLASTPSNPVQRLCFPGKSEREAWRFGEHDLPACKAEDSPTDLQTAVVIRILELVHEALLNDVVLSKRYQEEEEEEEEDHAR
jgi:hypothetical protein